MEQRLAGRHPFSGPRNPVEPRRIVRFTLPWCRHGAAGLRSVIVGPAPASRFMRRRPRAWELLRRQDDPESGDRNTA